MTLNGTFSFEPTATDPRAWVDKGLFQARNHDESIVRIAHEHAGQG